MHAKVKRLNLFREGHFKFSYDMRYRANVNVLLNHALQITFQFYFKSRTCKKMKLESQIAETFLHLTVMEFYEKIMYDIFY